MKTSTISASSIAYDEGESKLAAFGVVVFIALLLADSLFEFVMHFTGMSLSRVTGPLLLLSGLVGVWKLAPGVWYLLAWYALLVVRSFFLSPDAPTNYADYYISAFPQLLLAYQIIYQSIRSSRHLYYARCAYVVSCFFVLTSAAMYGRSLFVNNRLRFDEVGFEPNTLSSWLGLGVLFCIFNFVKRMGPRSLWALAAFLIAIPLMLTGSRGGLVSVAVAAVIPLVLLSGRFWWGLIGAAVFVALGFFLIQYLEIDRYATILEGNMSRRELIWQAALNLFWDNPLWGVGPGQVPFSIMSDYWWYLPVESYDRLGGRVDTHNTYLYLLDEGGLLGFGLIAAAVMPLLSGLWQDIKRKTDHALLGVMILIHMGLSAMTITNFYTKPLWLCLSLIAVSHSIDRQRVRSET